MINPTAAIIRPLKMSKLQAFKATPIRFADLQQRKIYRCNERWDELRLLSAEDENRWCATCDQEVWRVRTPQEFDQAKELGRCVCCEDHRGMRFFGGTRVIEYYPGGPLHWDDESTAQIEEPVSPEPELIIDNRRHAERADGPVVWEDDPNSVARAKWREVDLNTPPPFRPSTLTHPCNRKRMPD